MTTLVCGLRELVPPDGGCNSKQLDFVVDKIETNIY